MSYSDETIEIISTPSNDWPRQRPQPRRSNTGLIVGVVLAAMLVLSLAGLAVAHFAFDANSSEAHEARTGHEQITTLEPTVTTAPPADVAESPAVGTGTGTGTSSASGSTGAPSAPGITFFGPAPADAGTAGTDGGTSSDPTPVDPAVAPEPEITSFGATGTGECGPGVESVLRTVVWSTANASSVELEYPGGATHDVAASGSAEVYIFCGEPPATFVLRASNDAGAIAAGTLHLVA